MILVQMSDMHVMPPGARAYGVVETSAMLPPALAAAARLTPHPDCLLLTGDLVDAGTPEFYAALRTLLQQATLPFRLMPGNHDGRDALRAAFPEHTYLRGHDGYIQYAIEDYPVRILALDSVVPGEERGALCGTRLAWLAERLAEAPGRPTIVALHHPPFACGIAHMDAMALTEGRAELEALIARHPNVERVICGHVHRAITRRFGGTLVSCCPSTAHQIALDLAPDGVAGFTMEPPSLLVHAWVDGALVTHQAYIGEYPGPYPFG
ncbi:phosphodiesterase [Verticiella sediminum]|uniref:Phosphodiesterase n=1 Tax=Verticiella sediminum TaxID=1247510 RepID=A0A556ALT4_9BURK|nr:phosphodiesterase [Verticiella sediminum]TSH93837.1 phosphodiesterase [Verticiella sediminum]